MNRRFGLVLAALLLAPSLRADGESPADRLFREGREAFKTGNYLVACSRFAESEKLEPAAGTLLNLAHCEEKLDRVASAWMHARDAAARLPRDDDRVPIAQALIARLEPRLPRLRVDLHPLFVPAVVTVDGVSFPTSRAEPIDPGVHVVEAVGPGAKVRTVVMLREGHTEMVLLEKPVAPQPIVPSPIVPSAPIDVYPYRKVGIALGVLGVASIGVGIWSGVSALSARRTVARDCINKICNDSDSLDVAQRGKTFAIVSDVTLATGLISAGVGSYLFFAKTSVRPALTITPSGASFSLLGSFL